MKRSFTLSKFLFAAVFIFSYKTGHSQNVGINSTGVAPAASAGLDINFSDKGLLIPRVTLTSTTDVTTIASPADGLLVYNTASVSNVSPGFYYYSQTGSVWMRMASNTASQWTTNGTAVYYNAGSVAIGASSAAATAALDITATNKGLLIPRVALTGTTDATTIVSPANSLLVYNTASASASGSAVTPGYYYYNSGAWQRLATGGAAATSPWTVTGNNISNNNTASVGVGTSTFLASNAEKFLVDAGTTTSYNLINGKGTINNYLQLNIQNKSNGTGASSDVVATNDTGNESTNFVNMGINSSGNTSTGVLGGASTAYLQSTGNDFAIGNSTSGKNLKFFTGGTASTNEKMRISGLGKVGIGVTDPANNLVVKDTVEIRRTGSNVAHLYFTNTSGSGNFRLGGDGGDLFWQGGGGNTLQMGSYWTTVLAGDRKTSAFPAFVAGSAYDNIGVVIPAQRDASIPLVVQGNSATQTANLTEWRTSAGTALAKLTKDGYLGIGATTPAAKLHVLGTNPVKFDGIQTGTNGDSILTMQNGVVKMISPSSFATPSTNAWSLTGNNSTTPDVNFIGTTDAQDLVIKTNNAESVRIASDGNVGIGTSTFDSTNPEKLIVDVGDEGSINAISARGNNSGYVQINVQNHSNGAEASSDIVATNDTGNEDEGYIDMGINSSQNSAEGTLGGPSKAYIFSTGDDFVIGNGTPSKNLTLYSTNSVGATTEKLRLNSTGVTFSQSLKTLTYAANNNYTLNIDDYTVICNLSGNMTLNLPDATAFSGRVFFIKKGSTTNANQTITIKAQSGQTIDGASQQTITKSFGGMMVQSDGSNWYIIIDNLG